MKIPRHIRRHQKTKLRRLLQKVPIRAYRIQDKAKRVEVVSRRLAIRTEALFALYDIPEDFPLDVQWEVLARAVAQELFPGYRVLDKGPGGPSEERREKQRELFRRFQGYAAGLKRSSAAAKFLIDYRADCREAGFIKSKPFAEAAARFYRRMNVDPLSNNLQLRTWGQSNKPAVK